MNKNRLKILAVVIFKFYIFLGLIYTSSFASELPISVSVATEEEEKPAMGNIIDEVARIPGVPMETADAIFHPLRREIDRQREAGYPATLYPQSILRIISSGIQEKFDLEQIGIILAKGQKAISKGKSSKEVERIIIEGFKKGLKPTQIYDMLK